MVCAVPALLSSRDLVLREKNIVVIPDRVWAPMAEAREAGHVPDLAIARVVVVRIELACVEEPAARRAAIVVLASAVHRHDLADEGGGRVETAPAPLSARGTALEAAWPSFRPGPGQAVAWGQFLCYGI